MPIRNREVRHIRNRDRNAESIDRRPIAQGSSDVFGAVLEPPDACQQALATATVEYLGFNNEVFVNSIRGIGESGGEIITASDNGVDRWTPTVTTTYGPLVYQGNVTGVQNSDAVALAVSNGGIIWWGEDDGKIWRWTGASATQIAYIPDFDRGGGSLIEYCMAPYSTTGDLDDASSIRLLACGTDVAGLYELDPNPGSPVTYSTSNVTGGANAQSFGLGVNGCGGIYHGTSGSSPQSLVYRAQDNLNVSQSTGVSGILLSSGVIPSALNDGCHIRLSFSFQSSNIYNDGSSFNTDNSFSGWTINVGARGPGGTWVNVLTNTNEIIRINETQ